MVLLSSLWYVAPNYAISYDEGLRNVRVEVEDEKENLVPASNGKPR